MFKLLTFCLVFVSFSAQAAWKSDLSQSSINFLSTKKEHIVETHQFKQFAAKIDEQGNAELSIDLASVDTLIPIRDERMQKFLFKTDQFAKATITSKLDIAAISQLKAGQSFKQLAKATLDLHGTKVNLSAEILIVAGESGLLIQTIKPIVVDSRQFGLTAGVDKLRSLAGLPSISYSVPVTFSIQMSKQ